MNFCSFFLAFVHYLLIVPTNGTAVVTVSAETMDLSVSIEELLLSMNHTPGVVKAEVLAG